MSTTYQLGGYQFAKDLVFGWTIVPIGGSNPVPFSMLDMEDKSLSNYLDSLTYPSWVSQELKEVIAKYISAVYEFHKQPTNVPELKSATETIPVLCATEVEESIAIALARKKLLQYQIEADTAELANAYKVYSNLLADKVFKLTLVTDVNSKLSQIKDKSFGSIEIQCHGTKDSFDILANNQLIKLDEISKRVFPIEFFI